MSEKGNELTHILLAYARELTPTSSFSERVATMEDAREKIEALFAGVWSGSQPKDAANE